VVDRGGHSTKRARIGLCEIAGRRVAELMSEDIISANEDTPLSKLANILEKHRIKRVPILKHCSEKHLHRYVAEFDFRYANA
jgi:CBS domain-containing protein